MKVDRRGKFPGVRVHLNRRECIELCAARDEGDKPTLCQFSRQIANMIDDMLRDDPSLLADRSLDDIRAALEKERKKAIKKLAVLDASVEDLDEGLEICTNSRPSAHGMEIGCTLPIDHTGPCSFDPLIMCWLTQSTTGLHCFRPIDHTGPCSWEE